MPEPAAMSPTARSWYRARTSRTASSRPSGWLSGAARPCRYACRRATRRARSADPAALAPLRELGVIDQVVVVDHSTDGTGEIARSHGAEVHDQEGLLPEHGPVLGKGDAMWRGLATLTGELVCFLDADSEEFGASLRLRAVGTAAV